jgi:putative restriction endonuclease
MLEKPDPLLEFLHTSDARYFLLRKLPMATSEQWLSKLAKLKVDKARGDPAPHKPILLLVVLELAEQGLLPKGVIPLTPELAFRFCTYWSIVSHRRTQKPDMRYPFFHLKSDGIWSPLDENGKPTSERFQAKFAAMPSDFVAFAMDPYYRDKARRILIARYFEPYERLGLYALVGMPVPADDEIARDATYKGPEEAQKQGREARFRLHVVAAYNYTCALTRYRLTTITGGSIVDAAHIHEFADSRNNDPRNGLALSKNAHWLFDNGLWTLGDDYKVIVAQSKFAEAGPGHHMLAQYSGQQILLPTETALWPNPLLTAWHRDKKFKGA